MKRWICLCMTVVMLLIPVTALAEDISAKAAFLYHPQTGTVLYEKSADEPMLIASTTKIMTALVVLERCDFNEMVDITKECVGIEGSTMYLKTGTRYTVGELLYGMMLSSGNDAATALALHTAGSVEAFARLMNDKAADLSLKNSHFVNPHGLNHPEHYSTARDLALLTAAAMENDMFCEIFSTQSCRIQGITYKNHNKLLADCEGCTGGKTGYTEKAGRVLVSSCEREGLELICVTISAPDDWNDHKKLYDRAYDAFCFIPALDARCRRVRVVSGMSEFAELAASPAGVLAERGAVAERDVILPEFVFAPVISGQRAGEVHLTVDGETTIIPVNYAQTVFIDGSIPLTPWERFKRAWYLSCRYGVYYPDF